MAIRGQNLGPFYYVFITIKLSYVHRTLRPVVEEKDHAKTSQCDWKHHKVTEESRFIIALLI